MTKLEALKEIEELVDDAWDIALARQLAECETMTNEEFNAHDAVIDRLVLMAHYIEEVVREEEAK